MESPSARLVAEAQSASTVTDATGRVIALRRPNVLDRLRLFKAAGPALSQNHLWLGIATLAVSAISIDGVPVPQPATEGQIEGLVARLGDDGIEAIARALATEPDPDHRAYAGN